MKTFSQTLPLFALTLSTLLASNVGSADSSMPLAKPAAMIEVERQGYRPTVLESMEAAQALFSSMRKLEGGETQCHQRAMYWSYEMFENQQINSMKVTMFYGQKFINTFKRTRKFWFDKDYKWWYHTAPYVFVKDGRGGLLEVVLDRTFMDQAVTLDQWTHHFVAKESIGYVDGRHQKYMPRLSMTDSHCKELTNYRQIKQFSALYSQEESKYNDWIDEQKGFDGKLNGRLRVHAKEPWCMVRKFPMFYMQPESLQKMDCDVYSPLDAWKRSDTPMPNGQQQYPCLHEKRTSFTNKPAAKDLISAYDAVASGAEHKEIKRTFEHYAK